MNWSRVKSIMIIFLILVNFSLLSYVVFEEVQENKRNSQMAETVSALLEKNNISIDKKLIEDSAKNDAVQSFYADNIILEYENFSKKILGDNTKKKKENEFSSEKGTISFQGDYFKADGELLMQKTSKLNAVSVSDKYLKELGFDLKDSDKQLTEASGQLVVTYSKKIDKFPVFSTGLEVILNNSGITAIKGNWYNINQKNSSVSELKSVSGVLVEYKNRVKSGDKKTIKEITLGFSTHDTDKYHESVFLTPVFKIIDENNEIIYIDARENN